MQKLHTTSTDSAHRRVRYQPFIDAITSFYRPYYEWFGEVMLLQVFVQQGEVGEEGGTQVRPAGIGRKGAEERKYMLVFVSGL